MQFIWIGTFFFFFFFFGHTRSEVCDLNDGLTKVFAVKETDKGFRGLIEAVDNVLSVDNIAVQNPLTDLVEEILLVLPIIRDQETLHSDASADDIEQVLDPIRRLCVVAGNLSTSYSVCHQNEIEVSGKNKWAQ